MNSVSLPPSSMPDNADILRIAPISDLHLPKAESRFISGNRAWLDSMDFVVLLGDMVRCYATEIEYNAVRSFVDEMARPYSVISGNHEWYFRNFDENSGLYGEVWEEAVDEEQRAALERFRAFYGVKSLWRSFDLTLGRFVFLSLDKVESHKQEALSSAQLEWLHGEIEAAEEKPLFCFCHAPLMLESKLDIVYYEDTRSGCVELEGALKEALLKRRAPTFWMSGHVHLHPEHPLFAPYKCGGNVWQIHCPDSWGYGRWTREHTFPQRYEGPFGRWLEIDERSVTFWTHDHRKGKDVDSFRVDF